MHTTIKKASVKSDLFLAFEYDQSVHTTKNSIKTSSDAPIHDDLREAFDVLIPHFALICEEVSESICRDKIENPEAILDEDNPLHKYKVAGFSIGGQGDSEGVTVSGSKRLESGQVVNFNTPFVKYEDFKDYPFMSELRTAMDNLKSEVYEYLEGKQAHPKQIAMFTEEEENAI